MMHGLGLAAAPLAIGVMTLPVTLLALMLTLFPVGLSAQAQHKPFMADSSAERIVVQFRRSKVLNASWLPRIMRNDGTSQPEAKLEAIADRLAQLATSVSRDETDRSRTTEAGGVVAVFAQAGTERSTRGTAYQPALDRLIEIHRDGENRGVRSLALINMLRVSGHDRAVAYLRRVAMSADETAERAVTAMIIDVHGDVNATTPVHKAETNTALRELFDANAVTNENAKRSLAGWAQAQGWVRRR